MAAELHGHNVTHALNLIRQSLQIMECYIEDEDSGSSGYQAQTLSERAVGRPNFDIPFNQLSRLLEERFTVPQISRILGISIRTVRRRMTSYNLSVRSCYSQITDGDAAISDISAQFPCGNRQLMGHLIARGVRVQQHRVREAQRRVDPGGAMLRRRSYHVNGPLALWHIDGNHKLIRYVRVIRYVY